MMIFSVSEPCPKEESTNNCFRKTRRFLQISMLMSGYPSHLTPFAGLVPSLLNPVGITPSSPFQQLPPSQQQMEKLAGKKMRILLVDFTIFSTFYCFDPFYNFLTRFFSDAIIEARYGGISGMRKQRRSRTAFTALQLQTLERAFESTQVNPKKG